MANFSATILEIDILFVLGNALKSFSIEETDNNVLLFTSADFYNSIEEFKEVVPQEKFLDLLAVLFYGIIGFIIIYSPFLIGGS